MARPELERIPLKKLSSAKVVFNNSAGNNHVFLFRWNDEVGAVTPVKGWKVIGWATAFYPKLDYDNKEMPALVFERTDEPGERYKEFEGFNEGDIIWQHWPYAKDGMFILEEPKPRKKSDRVSINS